MAKKKKSFTANLKSLVQNFGRLTVNAQAVALSELSKAYDRTRGAPKVSKVPAAGKKAKKTAVKKVVKKARKAVKRTTTKK